MATQIATDQVYGYSINVKDFGVVGDGVTDDTAAIQAAFDAMNTGHELTFPPGVYLVTSGLTLSSKRGFKIRGGGSGDGLRTVIECSDAAITMLTLTSCKGFEISGFSLRSSAAGTPTPNGIKLQTACSNYLIHSITFSLFADAFNIAGGYIGTIRDCDFGQNIRDVNIASGGQSNHNFIVNNTFGVHNFNTTPCIQIADANNHVQYNAFECASSVDARIVQIDTGGQRCSIVGNVGTSGCGGIKSAVDDTICTGNYLVGDGLIPANEGMIEGKFSHIEGNTLSGGTAGIPGIRLGSSGIRSVIANNQFINNDSGVEFQSNTAVSVTGNVFTGVTTCFETISANTTIKSNQYHNCTSFGTATSLTNCDLEYVPAVGSLADADATPSVLARKAVVTANTGATTITDLDDGFDGQTVKVIFGDANTTVDFTASSLKGNGGADWTPASGDHMTCTLYGTDWYCDISDNTA